MSDMLLECMSKTEAKLFVQNMKDNLIVINDTITSLTNAISTLTLAHFCSEDTPVVILNGALDCELFKQSTIQQYFQSNSEIIKDIMEGEE